MRRAWLRLLALTRRDRLDRELDEDVRAHLELAEHEAQRAGLSPADARREALTRFGGLESIKEAHRDARGLPALERVIRDIRYGMRGMRRNPGFTAVVVGTLALGIGANSAIFSVVDAVLLRPLPYRDADRLVTVSSSAGPRRPQGFTAISFPDYQDIGALSDAVAGIAAFSNEHYNLTEPGEPRELQVTRTTTDLLGVLGAAPAVGRDFDASDSHAPVAIISHALWRSAFGGDERAIGRRLLLDGQSFTVIGVMPAAFAFPDPTTDVWVPVWWAMADRPDMAQMRMYRAFSTVARLAPDASMETLRGGLDALGQRITASGVATSKSGSGETFAVNSLRDQMVGQTRQPLLILFGAVALVLLIACVNAANLLVARANTREKEFAVRRAIGAGRWAIVQQLLIESVLLALVAAAVGLGVAAGGLQFLAAQLPQGYDVRLDATVLGFTIALAIVTGVGFGLAPALRSSSLVLEYSLRDSAGASVRPSRRRAQNALVVSEVALALVLLVGSALLIRSFIGVNAINPGFDPQGLLAARIRLTPERYPNVSQKETFFNDLLARLRSQPDLTRVSYADGLPLAQVHTVGTNPQSIRPDDPDDFLEMVAINVGPDFFSTARIPILQGRAFAADDQREGAPSVCIVSKALADRLWPHDHAVGQRGMGRQGDAVVVGVAADVRTKSLEREGDPVIYAPAGQDERSFDEMWIAVRSPHPLRVAPALRDVVRAEDPAQPIAEISTYDQIIEQQFANLTLVASLVTLFAAVALGLAVIGIAGVTAYAISQRTRELGIRIAMGARTVDMLGLVLGETAVLVGIGLALGLAAAFGVTRTLQSLLYGVTTTDPTTFAGTALALGVVALLATYLPARRAGRVDPVVALRSE